MHIYIYIYVYVHYAAYINGMMMNFPFTWGDRPLLGFMLGLCWAISRLCWGQKVCATNYTVLGAKKLGLASHMFGLCWGMLRLCRAVWPILAHLGVPVGAMLELCWACLG